jgi:nucleoside-diphosphate-sugar epimerase
MNNLIKKCISEVESLLPNLIEGNFKFLNGKSIFIVGASGLIGSYLASFIIGVSSFYHFDTKLYLGGPHKQKIDDLFSGIPNVVSMEIDASKDNIKITDNFDFIVHAGSPANPIFYSTKPVETILANFDGCKNLLSFCKNNNPSCRFLYISSGEVYGDQSPINSNGYIESQPGIVDSMLSRSCYTEGKRAGETLCACYKAEYGIDAMVCRSCFVFGPAFSDSDSRVVFQFIRNALGNQDIVLKSRGEKTRSYIYVFDACLGIVLILGEGKSGEAYNLARKGNTCSIKELAEKVILRSHVVLGNNLKLNFDLPNDIESKGFSPFDYAVQNPRKIYSELGFSPLFSIEDGIDSVLKIRREKQ